MSRPVYTLLLYLIMPVIVLRLLLRSLKAPAYRQRIPERFGFVGKSFKNTHSQSLIWLHAVSVGEVVAAKPLVDALLKRKQDVLITTMTPTGSAQVITSFAGRVSHLYLPYDLPGALNRFLAKVQPSSLIIMETELWPNLIHYCSDKSIPVLLVNARMSARSAKGYQRFTSLVGPMLKSISAIAAQSTADQNRLLSLGARPNTVSVTGSLKFHTDIELSDKPKDEFFSAIYESARAIVIAASTREGEEEKVLDAFSLVLEELPDTLLILVPRHPERFNSVTRLASKRGFNVSRRSANTAVEKANQVIIGDSMGELMQYYKAAQIAFVGGSLVDTGCQNVLEPAALSLPVVVGPSQFNFASICEELEAAGALITVQDQYELSKQFITWLQSPELALSAGQHGREVCDANQKALTSVLKLVDDYL